MKNRKGFTLIELLAVIIILGILMIIAIPSVTSYINNSRKSAYVNTAKEIIGGARTFVNEGKLEMFDTGATYYIPVSCISTENGQKSPYGDFVEDQAFVIVTYTGNNYNYFWISRDTTGQGVKTITPVGELDEDDIVSDINSSEITPTEPAETGKNTIKVLSKDDCKTFENGNSSGGEETGNIDNNTPICVRVTNVNDLHTAECSRTSNGCYANGYYIGGSKNTKTITYGKEKVKGSALASGDALDCDVNGNGIIDKENGISIERFYYVTDYKNDADEDVAVLIYYTNMKNQTTYAYDSTDRNNNGPITIYEQLPTITQWSNNQIIAPGTRNILTVPNNYTSNHFTYDGKSARLLTANEINNACGIIVGNATTGELDGCNYLLENVGRFETNSESYGYWLENPKDSTSDIVWGVGGSKRRVTGNSAGDDEYNGVRPVIEVLKDNIEN